MNNDLNEKRCAIYARKSTAHGMDQVYTSIDAQLDACAKYIEAHAANGWVLAKTFRDVAISGGTMERPGMQDLLTQIRAGKVDVVVTYKLDRISRSIRDFSNLMYELDQRGVSLVIVTQNFDTATPMGKLCINFLSSFAEFERDMIRDRIRDKAAANAAQGLWTGGSPPYGYRIGERRALLVEPTESAFVRRAFEMSAAMNTPKEIAEYLNHSGAPKPHTRKGAAPKDWTMAQVRDMLGRRLYAGVIVRGDKEYPGQHDAIVTEQQWQDSFENLQNNKPMPRKKHTHSDVTYPLRGIITCPICGRKLSGHYSLKGGKVRRYYVCPGRVRGDKSCTNPNLPAPVIEEAVAAHLADYAYEPAVQELLRERYPLLTRKDIAEALSNVESLVGQLSHSSLDSIFHSLFKSVVYDAEAQELRIEKYIA